METLEGFGKNKAESTPKEIARNCVLDCLLGGGTNAAFQNVSLHFGEFFQNGKETGAAFCEVCWWWLFGERFWGGSRRRPAGANETELER